MHYVYVLRSVSDDGFYIGYSANLRKRFKEHVQGGSFATSYRGPWKLIYYEAYLEQADALGREKYLKSGAGRRFLKAQLAHYLRKSDQIHRDEFNLALQPGPQFHARPRGQSLYDNDLHACAQQTGRRRKEPTGLKSAGADLRFS